MYRQSEKNLISSNIPSRCPHNMANFGPLAAEIDPVVWGTPANFNGFRVLAALLHGTLVVGVRQEGTTYIRQGGHNVGHWTTFLVGIRLHFKNNFPYLLPSVPSAGWSVCLPLLIFPCTIKSRSSLLAPAHPGGLGKRP